MNAIPPPILAHPTITYRLTRWYLFANHLTLWMRNRILQGFLILFVVWQLWSRLSPIVGFASPLGLALQAAGVLVFFGGVVVVTLVAVGFAMAFFLPQRGVICEHTLEITDEGLIETTDMNRTVHKWPSVSRIMNIFGYLFIYVGDQNAHQVPRRYIPPEQMANFERELRARCGKSR
jgi:hypothetical protein